MKQILSFGGGVQTSAIVVLAAMGKIVVDECVFSDVGCEKPETYYYIEEYIEPLLKDIKIPLTILKPKVNIYDYHWERAILPSVLPKNRRCTDKFKIQVIKKYLKNQPKHNLLIGFSFDEQKRISKNRWPDRKFPLAELEMTATDCKRVITEYGWPVPTKSACFFCPATPLPEWNWLKNNHSDLFDKAILLEKHYHDRRPDMRNAYGLLGSQPLRYIKEGKQPELISSGEYSCGEYSCYSGFCSH